MSLQDNELQLVLKDHEHYKYIAYDSPALTQKQFLTRRGGRTKAKAKAKATKAKAKRINVKSALNQKPGKKCECK
jgi:hypothetical protein